MSEQKVLSGSEFFDRKSKVNCQNTTDKVKKIARSEENSEKKLGEYVPGTPGEVWSEEEVRIVRLKILELLSQDPTKQSQMFPDGAQIHGRGKAGDGYGVGSATEALFPF